MSGSGNMNIVLKARRILGTFFVAPLHACGVSTLLPALRKRRGQNTVEYILMLGVMAALVISIGGLFYKRILGGFFTIVGMVLGAGQPK